MEGVFKEIGSENEANLFCASIIHGGSEVASKIKHLKITIDSSGWTDVEDDTWCMALGAFAPHSKNLEHLHITIKGSVLFTQFNYIRPALHTMVAFGYDPDERSSDSEASDAASSSEVKPPYKRPPKLQEIPSPTSKFKTLKYTKRAVPYEKVGLHMAEKAIVSALLSLRKPIPCITIQGPMELGLRRCLIATLNPEWTTSAHCYAQAGYAPADSKVVEETERREELILSTGSDMVKIGLNAGSGHDGEDFGTAKGRSRYSHAGMVVPTSKAGRQAYGWKATSVRAWKGPTERLTPRIGE